MLLLDVSVENNEELLLDRTRQWCIVLCNKTLGTPGGCTPVQSQSL